MEHIYNKGLALALLVAFAGLLGVAPAAADDHDSIVRLVVKAPLTGNVADYGDDVRHPMERGFSLSECSGFLSDGTRVPGKGDTIAHPASRIHYAEFKQVGDIHDGDVGHPEFDDEARLEVLGVPPVISYRARAGDHTIRDDLRGLREGESAEEWSAWYSFDVADTLMHDDEDSEPREEELSVRFVVRLTAADCPAGGNGN